MSDSYLLKIQPVPSVTSVSHLNSSRGRPCIALSTLLKFFLSVEQEGSIGHDLVIRPIPDSMTSAAQDDEMFMDPSSMADMVSIDTGLPLGEFPLQNYLKTTDFLHKP